MFMLHCILVATLKGIENEECDIELSEKELIEECRQEALDATEQYRDHVFDWRKEDADIWAGSHPNCGVILGSKEPDAFRRYLTERKDEPLLAAKGLLENAMRTLTDLPPVGPELIQAIWDNDKLPFWGIGVAMSLATGDYRFESGFYSAPDASAKISQKTLRKALEEPEKYALVFLDYHL